MADSGGKGPVQETWWATLLRKGRSNYLPCIQWGAPGSTSTCTCTKCTSRASTSHNSSTSTSCNPRTCWIERALRATLIWKRKEAVEASESRPIQEELWCTCHPVPSESPTVFYISSGVVDQKDDSGHDQVLLTSLWLQLHLIIVDEHRLWSDGWLCSQCDGAMSEPHEIKDQGSIS